MHRRLAEAYEGRCHNLGECGEVRRAEWRAVCHHRASENNGLTTGQLREVFSRALYEIVAEKLVPRMPTDEHKQKA
jgi:hypothetical protein